MEINTEKDKIISIEGNSPKCYVNLAHYLDGTDDDTIRDQVDTIRKTLKKLKIFYVEPEGSTYLPLSSQPRQNLFIMVRHWSGDSYFNTFDMATRWLPLKGFFSVILFVGCQGGRGKPERKYNEYAPYYKRAMDDLSFTTGCIVISANGGIKYGGVNKFTSLFLDPQLYVVDDYGKYPEFKDCTPWEMSIGSTRENCTTNSLKEYMNKDFCRVITTLINLDKFI